ncbi:MAG: hypothetical protein ABEH58_00775 [Haloplanus sp.]
MTHDPNHDGPLSFNGVVVGGQTWDIPVPPDEWLTHPQMAIRKVGGEWRFEHVDLVGRTTGPKVREVLPDPQAERIIAAAKRQGGLGVGRGPPPNYQRHSIKSDLPARPTGPAGPSDTDTSGSGGLTAEQQTTTTTSTGPTTTSPTSDGGGGGTDVVDRARTGAVAGVLAVVAVVAYLLTGGS